jgi:hypothetical protein
MSISCESTLTRSSQYDKVISSITSAFSKYLYEHTIDVNFFRGFIAAVTTKGHQLNGIFEYFKHTNIKDFQLNSRIIDTLIAVIEPSLRTKICNDCIALVGTSEYVSQIKFNSYVYAACSMCKNCIQLYHQNHLLPDSSMHDGIANGLLIVYSQILKPIVPEPLLSIPSKFNIFGPQNIMCRYDIVPSYDFEWHSDYYDECDSEDEKFSIAVEQIDGSILTCTLYNDNLTGSYYWLFFTQKTPAGINKTLGILRWYTVEIDHNECDVEIHAEFEDTRITFGKSSVDGENLSLHVTYCWRILCFIGRLLSQGGKFIAQPTGLCIIDPVDQCMMKISGSIMECSIYHPRHY